MKSRVPPGRGRPSRLAVGLTVIIGIAVTAVALVNTSLAGRLVQEHGFLEWLQVGLFWGAAWLGAGDARREWAARRSGAPDVLLTVGFGFLAVSEMELPRLILGKSVKIGRLTRDVAAGSPREVAFALLAAGLVIALVVYALRYRGDLIAWGSSAFATPEGRLLLLGLTLLVATELFERSLNRMMGELPRPLVEETLEVLAALYCFLAMAGRRARVRAAGRRRIPAPRIGA